MLIAPLGQGARVNLLPLVAFIRVLYNREGHRNTPECTEIIKGYTLVQRTEELETASRRQQSELVTVTITRLAWPEANLTL